MSPGRHSVLGGMMVGLSEPITAANLLYEQIEKITVNKAQWQRLKTRVRLPIDTIDQAANQDALQHDMATLREQIATVLADNQPTQALNQLAGHTPNHWHARHRCNQQTSNHCRRLRC